MVKALTRTVFFGTFRHTVDDKNRVAIPAKWRAAAKGSKEFYVLPDPKNCLVVLTASAMEKMLERADDISIGEYERRDVVRVIASRAHGSPCDSQGRIGLTDQLLQHAGIEKEAILVGTLTRFEIWSPQRWAEVDRNGMQNFSEAAKQVGL
ncbi:MAG TPA: division/cell wall cluster transcriptional repressor MraZ [Verrucomicrobiae bacterium]|nr:division/cell wall cluster transcriptional repressor MraZ [Verrucomicrobiae bacterium]